MELAGRARRRHDKWRMVQRAKWVMRHIWSPLKGPGKWRAHHAERLADNLKACSCWACSPQREKVRPAVAGVPRSSESAR